ncbi:sugar transferase [Deinococcus sp. D7000]|nr:sugar transferase [Deinococcus sp. D7000]
MVTVAKSARAFLKGQLRFFKNHGYEVHVASSPVPEGVLQDVAYQEGARAHTILIAREIMLNRDIHSLRMMWNLMKQLRPQITNVGTPKAGLLGGLAAVLTGVPARIYTLHGLRLETVTGPKRQLLFRMEQIACACAHRVICVSPSLRERVVELGIVSSHKAIVLKEGTSNGVDVERFAHPPTRIKLTQLRETLHLPEGTPTIGFVGRFVRDKGIAELMNAFAQLYTNNPKVRLLLLGDYEEGDPVSSEIRHIISTHPGVIQAGFVPDTAPYYHLMDVLALPTYREGFPGVPLEAAAAGKPVVSSDATGAVDAVIHEETGLTVPVGDTQALTAALNRLLNDQTLARRLGRQGRERVLRDFQSQAIWEALDQLYQELLADAKTRRGRTIKRGGDILISSFGLALLAVPMLLLALIIHTKLGSPVIFRQQRPGLKGKPFTMYKFRTMLDTRDENGQLLSNNERLTSFGKLLRSTSLDELPELINVLRGDMSIVGPRPLLMEYLAYYSTEQARRHNVRPGITGWAQVNGRNAISWEKKFDYDIWYINNYSLKLDLKIILLTIQKVFNRENVNASQNVTMERFTGNKNSSGMA